MIDRPPMPMPMALLTDVRLLLPAVLISGLAAALTTKSAFITLTTAAIAIAIARSANNADAEVPELVELPQELQETLARALTHLDDDSDAECLLRDVVRQAEPLYATHASAFDERHDAETRANTTELVTVCCDVALQLGQVDELRAGEILVARNAADRADTRARYEATRTLLAGRLTDAAATLAALYVAGVEHGTPASDRVAELVQELREDASARGEAQAEVQRLLRER